MGQISVSYRNWGRTPRKLTSLSEPTDINPTPLTHILYAFADIQSDGTIVLTDSYADEQVGDVSIYLEAYGSHDETKKHFPGDSWDESGNNLYGCLKQVGGPIFAKPSNT